MHELEMPLPVKKLYGIALLNPSELLITAEKPKVVLNRIVFPYDKPVLVI